MTTPLKADDLWPLVHKLPAEEKVRLAHMAIQAAEADELEDAIIRTSPPLADGSEADEDALSWEDYGWGSMEKSA